MDIQLANQEKLDIYSAVVVGIFEGKKELPVFLKGLDKQAEGLLKKGLDDKDFKGEIGQIKSLTPHVGSLKTVIFLGLGDAAKYKLAEIEKPLSGVVRALRDRNHESVGVVIASFRPNHVDLGLVVQKVVEIVYSAHYAFTKYKTKDVEKIKSIKSVVLLLNDKDISTGLQRTLDSVRGVMDLVTKCRDIINEPPNICNGDFIVNHAKTITKNLSIKVSVHEENDLKKMGMGGILAVGGASVNRPKLLVLEYWGDKSHKKDVIALVGKGVTFDSGGLNLKPSSAIATMKSDMSGAATVIHVIAAAAKQSLKRNIVVVAPLVENMPSGSSYRPDDVVKTYAGIMVEINNTDAEGRMILCDGLAYVNKMFEPKELVSIATLTGAAAVVLGNAGSPYMATDEKLAQKLELASQRVGEKVWRLPFWPYFDELIKSDIGDIKQITEDGQAGTIVGGAFLKTFVGNTPYIHIDIAGVAFAKTPTDLLCKGATGFGVKLLLELCQ